MLTPEQVAQLDAPLNPALVKTKPTPGSPKYLEGHEAMAAANRIFGYGGWGYTVESIEGKALPGGMLYRAFVTVTVAGSLPKTDVGCEIASDTRSGEPPSVQAHETAIKGAVTDGIKRALRSYGDQFGASLYDKDADLRGEYAQWQREQAGGDHGTQTPGGRPASPAPRPALTNGQTMAMADRGALMTLVKEGLARDGEALGALAGTLKCRPEQVGMRLGTLTDATLSGILDRLTVRAQPAVQTTAGAVDEDDDGEVLL